MSKLKKMMSLVLMFAMMLTLATPFSSAAAEEYVPSYPIVDEPITVTCVVLGKDMTNERILWKELAKLTNINVEFINIENDQLNVYLAGNEWPDFFHSGLSVNNIYDYGVLGQKFVNFYDYKDIMPNFWKLVEEYPMLELTSRAQDGNIYALSRVEESVTLTNAREHFRGDILEANNIAEPATLDEFYEALKQLKDINGGAAPMADIRRFDDWLFPAFGEYALPGMCDDGTGTVIDNRATSQYRDYLSYVNKLYSEGLLHKEYLTLDANSIGSLIKEGEVVFFGEAITTVTEEVFPDGKLNLGTLSPLVKTKGDTPECVENQPIKALKSFAINKESKYVEEICKLADIAFATEEVVEGSGMYGLAFNYGPEGLCIHLNEDNTYDLTMPDGSDGFTTSWMLANLHYDYLGIMPLKGYLTSTPGNSQARQIGYDQKVNPYCTRVRFPNSYFVYEDAEMMILDQYSVDYNNYISEMKSKFIMGVEDINDDAVWAAYCEKLESYGMKDLVKVEQAAYDRFMGK